MPWTPQQENAINSTGRSVIVSAAAGSGKTAVLVERVIRQITDENNPVPADKIIIVTFTNDAAAELRQRLNLKLQEEISKKNDNRFLLKQYTLFQSAKISTIDSFCLDIIRNNAEQLDISSGFSILDEERCKIMKNQAIEDTMQLWSREYPDKYGLLYDKFCKQDDSEIAVILSEISTFLESVSDREVWLENTEKELNKKFFKDSVYYKQLSEKSGQELNAAYLLANQNFRMIENELQYELKETSLAKLYEQIDNEIALIEFCIRSLDTDIIPEIPDFPRLVSGVNKICPKYGINRDAYKGIIKSYISNMKNIEIDIKENSTVFSIIKEMLLDFYKILWDAKCQKNAISFDDGERLVIDMLSETDENGKIKKSPLAKELSEKYSIIMIDEYQDSNDKQDLIFKLLSKNFNPTENKYGNNVFLVGDVKQAIYRFRLANPDNFINTLKYSVPYTENPEAANVSVFLNKNFRSSPEVINYVNYVFENLMSEKCGDIDYNQNERLYFGADSEYSCPDPTRKTEIIIINDNCENDYQNENENENKSITAESECVAEKIAGMLKSGYEVNLKNGLKRPCEPKDFCILSRETAYFDAFIKSLRKRGIYARGEDKSGYLKSRETAILIDILKIIDNPLLDIPAVSVMMSPMFMFTSQEIAEIRAADKNTKIYVNIQKICEKEYIVPDTLYNKCVKFRGTIQEFRLYSIVYSIEELIEKIYDTTDFLSIMQQFVDGEKKKANLRMLIQYARNYEKNASSENGGGLSGFLRYIDTIQSNKTDLPSGKISAVSENFVSVKTIHKSKGLEYPFIFLVKTDINFYKKLDDKKKVICGQDSTIGFKLKNPDTMNRIKTIPFDMLHNSAKKKNVSEQLRLMYVALTRAKQKIFITLEAGKASIENLFNNFKNNDLNTFKTAPMAKNIGEWIWLTLFIHEKFEDINKKLNLCIGTKPEFNDDLFDISYFSMPQNDNHELQTKIESAPPINPEKLEDMRRIMSFTYNLSRSKIPSKMSVTQLISDENTDSEITLNQPQFILENTNLAAGTERGTIIHKFFQFFDFNSDIQDLEDEIQNMADKNFFTENEISILPRDLIKAFFKSSLYKRIKSADKIERERSFMISANEINYTNEKKSEFLNSDGMITGIIDLIIHEPDGLVIVDYKSDKVYSENLLVKRYSQQIAIYKSAVELIYNKPVKETIIYSTQLQKTISL